MRYHENYTIVITRADGTTESAPYDDIVEVSVAYDEAERLCGRGETVELHRSTYAVLTSRMRAR